MKITSSLLLALFCLSTASAEPPSFVLDFEQPEGNESTSDVLGNIEEIPLSKASHVSTADAKVGSGSLLIQAGVRNAPAGFYLSSSSRPELFAATPALTIAGWIKLESNDTGCTLLRRSGKSERLPGSFSLGIDRLQRLAFEADGVSVRSKAFEVPVDQWFHIAATYDAGKVTLYLDGVELAGGAVPAETIPAIDGDASFSSFLHSRPGNRVDELVFLGNRALSGEEVARLMDEPLRK